MPLSSPTPGYARPSNSFSNPVSGNLLDPAAASATWSDYDTAIDTLAKKAARGDIAQSLSNAEKAQALANIGGVGLTIGAVTSIASAATVDLGAQATFRVLITGTTTITSFGAGVNQYRQIRFDGVLTLTQNATTLILPTGANITTAAGDVAICTSDGAGNWRVVTYQRADGTALGIDARYVPTTGYQDPNLFDSYLPGGIAAPVTFAAVTRGEIKLKEQYNVTTGSGISATERARNKTRMYNAFQEASIERRPVKFPRGEIVEMDCSTGGILVNLDNVEIDLNQATLRHAGTENSTMFQVQKTAAQINNFKMYNGTLDGNAQGGKTGQFYILAGLFHSGTYLEDITFLDPFGCSLHFSDSYTSPGRPYPAMISSNMIVRNCRTVRSTANRSYMTTYPAMFQSDQAVITHVRNLLIDGYYAEISGMSGISIGLSENVTFRRGTFDACGAPVYCETLTGFVLNDISVVNHQHWQGSAANNFNTSAIWLTDGDMSSPSSGFGSCRDGIVSNVRIQSISRTNAGGDYKGVLVTGRDGSGRGAQNITISNVNARGMSGGLTGASAVTLEGQIISASVCGVVADNCSIALRANTSYTTSGGSAANLMTGVAIDNVTARACGYSFYASGSDPTHVSTFIRNSFGGGAAYSIVNSIGVQGFVP